MKKIRGKLTYANVVSTLCLFLVLGGGAAFAASHLGKNSVGSKQLKKNSVVAAKIKDGAVSAGKLAPNAVTTGKIANEAVTTGKIANDAVTGAKVNEGSLRFTCNNPATAVLILGGPCVYKTTKAGGATWNEAIQACQVGVPGARLPTVAEVEAYAHLGGVPWKEILAFTADLAGNGPNPPAPGRFRPTPTAT